MPAVPAPAGKALRFDGLRLIRPDRINSFKKKGFAVRLRITSLMKTG
jgi:hypothetical protein